MTEHHQIVIIGTGPAGFTAGIYSGRALLDTIIFEGNQPGGQLTITTEVENFPGFAAGIQGPELMNVLRDQAQRFGAKTIYETIVKVDFSKKPFQLWSDKDKHYTADSVIVSTGASARRLHGHGEDTYWGYGVSACATCDGFFFRGLKVYVVGGGDSAMEETNFLTRFAESVTIIHRRQEFRASKIMLERAKNNPKVSFMLDSVIDEFLGEEQNNIKRLTSLKVRNIVTNETQIVPADGVFYAIGHTPNTKIFEDFLDMDENGYILTQERSTYTNIPGIFACGDAQDHVYKQAISAAGTGCMAAIDAERWLAENHN